MFLERVLEPPSYGFLRNGGLYVPKKIEILSESFRKLNIFKSKKNWLSLLSWSVTLSFSIPLYYFFTHYFSWHLLVLGFFYSMVGLGSYGTFWFHRYCTHRAFQFKNSFVREICRNLAIKIIPDETYIISHHVHHRFSEKPGDPYNVHGGWLYCFLADINHQGIRRDLSQKEYKQLCKLMNNTGVRVNTFEQYLKWGTLCHPFYTVTHFLLNWLFWFACFYTLGGMPLVTALFGFAGVWAVGVRTFNYDGHGGGKDLRREGIDFNRADLSVNRVWPGYVAGEWHNNHHLLPHGVRSGFLPYQLDIPWLFIFLLIKLGFISSYRDDKEAFLRDYVRVQKN